MHVISDAGQPQLIMTGGQATGVMRLPLTPAAMALVPNTEDDEEILMFAEPDVIELSEELLQRKVELTTRPQRKMQLCCFIKQPIFQQAIQHRPQPG